LVEDYAFGSKDIEDVQTSDSAPGWDEAWLFWCMTGIGYDETLDENLGFFSSVFTNAQRGWAKAGAVGSSAGLSARIYNQDVVSTPIAWISLLQNSKRYKAIVEKYDNNGYQEEAEALNAAEQTEGEDEDEQEEVWIDNLKDVLEERRFQEQCYLIENFKAISTYNQCTSYWAPPHKKKKADANNSADKKRMDPRGNFGFMCVNPDPHEVIHRLTTARDLSPYSSLLPHQIARLEPRLRFFKLAYPTRSHHETGNPIEKEIIFSSHDQPSTIDSMLSNAIGRHDGVGIKRFSWTNLGSSDADVNIKCTLELFFRNLEDLDSVYQDGRPNPRSRYGTFMDLIIFGPAREKINKDPYRHGSLEWDPDAYELKVALGWTPPRDNEMVGPALQNLIKYSGTYLRLGLLAHRFNFKEDGSGTLVIEFQGWAETRENSVKADILTMTAPMLKRLKWLEKKKQSAFEKHAESQRALEEQKAQREADEGTRRRTTLDKTADAVDYMADWIQYQRYDIAGQSGYEAKTADVKAMQTQEKLEKMEKDIEDFNQQIQVAKYERMVSRITKSNRIFYIDIDRAEIGNIKKRQLSRKQIALSRSGDKKAKIKIPQSTFKVENIQTQTSDFLKKKGMDLLVSSTKKGDEEETFLSEEKLIDFSQEKDKDKLRLNFFFLGDLMWHAMDMAVMSIEPKTQNIRYLMGSLTFIDSKTKKQYAVNMADIPISLNLFMVWFMHRVVKPKKDSYMLKDFIRDVVNDLVLNALSSQCFAEYPTRPRFNMLRVSSPGYGKGKDRVSKTATGRINSALRGIKRPGAINLSSARTKKMFFYNYLFIHSVLPASRRGDPKEDAKNGIYHFYVGADRGLMQGITFDKVDQPGVREARTTMEGVGAIAAQLRHQYNVKITCVGNTIFRPGMYVYVNPRVSGGRANAKRSLTFKLGLGGYVFITKVENIIEAGKFVTILYGINDGMIPAGTKGVKKSLPNALACTSDNIKSVRELWIGSDKGVEPKK